MKFDFLTVNICLKLISNTFALRFAIFAILKKNGGFKEDTRNTINWKCMKWRVALGVSGIRYSNQVKR